MFSIVFVLAIVRIVISANGPTLPSHTFLVEEPFWFAAPVNAPRAWLDRKCALLPFDHGVLPVPLTTGCTIIQHHRLGKHASAIWHSTLARHALSSTQSDEIGQRTFSDIELVLFREPTVGTSGLVAVARLRATEDIVRDFRVEMVEHSAGTVLGVTTCWNGTAGCYQQIHLYRDGRWRALPKVEELLVGRMRELNLVVGSDSLRVGPAVVDLRTLRGAVPLYRPRDGGCCPSNDATFQLRLIARGLVVTKLDVTRARDR